MDLSIDDSFISLLVAADDLDHQQNPISDETYARSLHLQEAIFSSLKARHLPKPENLIKLPKLENLLAEIGQPSMSHSAQLIPCEICTETKTAAQFLLVRNCPHSFCTQCIAKYVTGKIHKGTMVNLLLLEGGRVPCPWPDCKGWLEVDSCRAVVGPDVLVAWDRAVWEFMILPSQRVYCPYESCPGVLVREGDGTGIREAECPYCHRLFCARCGVTWHAGIGCEEFLGVGEDERDAEDRKVVEAARKKGWQRCPNCRFFVEKKDGCLHMTCRCKFQFCYACGEAWTSNHVGCK